ncbi:hypothetical protein JCM11251_003610 [Rhodosporidiobolus azoricus]
MLPDPPLTLHDIPLDSLSTLDTSSDTYRKWTTSVVDAVTSLLASLPLNKPSSDIWSPQKLFHAKSYPTQTWNQARGSKASDKMKLNVRGVGETDGLRWHCRQTKVTREQGTYEDFERGLLRDHTPNEKAYIEACIEADEVKILKKGELEVWRTRYNNSPASPRQFTFLLLTLSLPVPPPPAAQLRSFTVVSIPVLEGTDEKHDGKYVKGKYVSVEHVQETEEGGVVWTMAVASDPGGSVPHMLSEYVMCSKIAEDVPSFLEWVKKPRA